MAFAIAPNNAFNIADIEAQKAAAVVVAPQPDPIYANVGGDTFATATVIPAIPYGDTGNTSGYVDNYNSCIGCFDCPYSATGGRDVVYKYVATANIAINVDLCSDATNYDTKTYVCDGVVTNIVGCSDDECGVTPPVGWKSWVHCAQLVAGHTYYIVVDGYSSTDYGNYTLSVNECVPCIVNCPPGSLAEGEPTCFPNYYDSYNGGCNSIPPAFTNLPCNQNGGTTTVCGTYGVYYYGAITYRDTDWYQINLTSPAAITWCATGKYQTLVGVIDGNFGCPVSAFYDYAFGAECTPQCVTDNLPAGTWWLFVSTPGWDTTWVCGGNYVATLTGYNCPPVAVEPTSWGTVKNLYR
jgi:hypothetical protein